MRYLNYPIRIFLLILLIKSFLFSSQELEKVTIQLEWKYQFQFAGFIAAKEKGFYEEVGLDVELREFNNHINIIDSVVNGDAQYGTCNANLLVAKAEGKPLVLLSSYLKYSPYVIIARPEIQTPKDLIGKKLMASYDELKNSAFNLLFKVYNINFDNLNYVQHSFNAKDFIEGKVDAMTAFTSNELYEVVNSKIPFHIINPADYGFYSPVVNLFTLKNEVIHNEKRVQAIINATNKGWEYAINNSEEIISIIYEKYSKQKSTDALRFEAKEIKKLMMLDVYKIGSVDKEILQRMAMQFSNIGLIARDFNLKYFFLDELDLALNLTKEEKSYLQTKNSIKMCIDPDWMPYEKLEDGKYVGMSADWMKIVAKKIKKPFVLVPTKNFTQTIEFLKERNCDIIPMAMATPGRRIYLDFTKPYTASPLVLATTNDKLFISNIQDLKDKKIGIVKGYALIELLKEQYSNLYIVEVDSIYDGLSMVENGKLFGFIDSLVTVSYEIQHSFINSLKITGKFDEKFELSMASRNDEPLLSSILQKALLAIDPKTEQNILNQWISVRYEKSFDYSVIWKILGLFFIVLLGILYWNRLLKKMVSKEVEKNREKDKYLYQQSRLAQMGEMIGYIAHQWRQPLSTINSIVLNLEVAFNTKKLNEEVLENKLNEIEMQTGYMSKTIDDFKNFFKSEKEKSVFDVYDTIVETLVLFDYSLRDDSMEISIKNIKNSKISGYRQEYIQVILILLNNAKDVLSANNIENPKIVIQIDRQNDKSVVTITDNGGGIAEDIIDKIFDPYFTTKFSAQGTGLGLYMAKMIIENSMNGELMVKNRNDGAEFILIMKENT